jgi:hypothetical protein
METTLTMAGQLALAGAARPSAAFGAPTSASTTAAHVAHVEATLGGYGTHQSLWTSGAIAKPATSMVFDRKNRPTRQPSELSP